MTEMTKPLFKGRALAALGAMAVMLAGCSSPEQDAAAIEREILASPGAEDLWRTVKEQYPEDFAVLISRLQALNFADRRDEEITAEIGGKFLIEFIERIAPDAIKAPAPELIAWSRAESELYATLQRGAVSQCAALTMGQAVMVDPSNVAAIAAISRRTKAIVNAAAAARDNPQEYAEPEAADWDRLGEAIAATGIAPELQATLGSEDALFALTEAQQCEVGVALYTGIMNLPDDVEPSMAAFMLGPE